MERSLPLRLTGSAGVPFVRCQLRPLESNQALLLPVDLPGRLELFFGDLERRAVTLDRAEEAGLVAFVAGGADLVHLDQKSVAVAVERDTLDGLGVAAAFAFHPELLARPARSEERRV